VSAALALVVKRKGTTVTYVGAAGGNLQATRDRADASLTITYEEDERRLPVGARLSYHEAFRMLRQETGQRMAVINASAETSAIYGTGESRASTFLGETLPLTYLVDLALKDEARAKDGRPLLVAVFLGEGAKTGVPLIVIGLNADRSMVLQDLVPTVANLPATITNVLGAMVAANALRGLEFDPRQASRNDDAKRLEQAFQEERVISLCLTDLMALARGARTYPRERMYRGVSRRVFERGAVIASASAVLLSAGFLTSVEWLRRSAADEALVLEAAMEKRRSDVRTKLLDRLNGLAARVSLDPVRLFSAGDALATSGGKVTLAATLDASRITLVVPQLRERLAPGSERRTAAAARQFDVVTSELRTPAPEGWARQSIESSGDLNAWLVSFTSAPVERDLLDLVGTGSPSGAALLGGAAASGHGAAGGSGARAIGGR
jgi:hypothetical protein